jgi:hypothetical protein
LKGSGRSVSFEKRNYQAAERRNPEFHLSFFNDLGKGKKERGYERGRSSFIGSVGVPGRSETQESKRPHLGPKNT